MHMLYRFASRLLTVSLVTALLVLGVIPLQAQEDAPIRVGSKNFAEGEILAQLIMVALEDAGFAVEDVTNIGPTFATREALINNQIDVYVEYTGTAYSNFFNDVDWFSYDPGIANDESRVLGVVSSVDLLVNDLVWLAPARANNAYRISVQRAFAEENGLVTMSDFARYVNEGGEVLLVGSQFFVELEEALPAFETTYAFDLQGGQLLVITDATTPITHRAVGQGVNGVNAGMAYTTDGGLVQHDLVVLEDNLRAQAAFQPTPVFQGEIMRAHPEIAGILNPIFTGLTEEAMRQLNVQVESEGRTARDVAADYLTDAGFLGDAESDE